MKYIEHRWRLVESEILSIAESCARDVSAIQIMLISKTHPFLSIKDAVDAGARLFGESRVQEVRDKFSDTHTGDVNAEYVQELRKNIELHMVGTLQSNKVGHALKYFDCIQSVDSLSLLQKIQDRCLQNEAQAPFPIFLQICCSDFDYKHGFNEYNGLREAVETCFEYELKRKTVRLSGLMTIGPNTNDEGVLRKAFACANEWKSRIYDEYKNNILDFKLSMGMSSDYKIAIEEGSDILRIGSAVFGGREYATI